MSRYLKLFMNALFLPVISVFGGIPGEGGEGSGSAGSGAAGTNGGTQGTAPDKTLHYTQAEMDDIIEGRLARAKKSWEKETSKGGQGQAQGQTQGTQGQQGQTQGTQQGQSETDTKAYQEKLATIQKELLDSKVEVAMSQSGVDSKKLARAIRLIDHKNCVDKDGNPSAEGIKKEVEALLKDFPELKAAQGDGSGFKFGADGSQQGKAGADQISSIFGNTKKN